MTSQTKLSLGIGYPAEPSTAPASVYEPETWLPAPWSDSTGTAIVLPNGRTAEIERSRYADDAGRTIMWDYERDGLGALTVVSASCTIAAATLNGVPCVKITGTGAAQTNVDINISTKPVAISGGVGIDMAAERANTTQLTARFAPDAAFAAYASATVNPTASSKTSCWTYNSTQEYAIVGFPAGSPADSGFTHGGTWGGAAPTYPTEISYVRLRADVVGGQIPVSYVRRVYAIAPRKSRVCIVLDDGYATAYRLLKPVLDSYKIKATWSIIPSEIDGGTATFMKWSDVGNLFDQGHEIVTHGRNTVSWFGSVAAFMADVRAERQRIRDLGYATARSDRCYVWPGGEHQAAATDDTAYRDAMRAEGFMLARSASSFDPFSWTADTWPDPLTLPIVGHTQKASSGLEATNIALMVSRINNAALFGSDIILMLHAGVPSTDTSWGSNGGLNIRTTDLATICAAIVTNINAGTQRAVSLGELV